MPILLDANKRHLLRWLQPSPRNIEQVTPYTFFMVIIFAKANMCYMIFFEVRLLKTLYTGKWQRG